MQYMANSVLPVFWKIPAYKEEKFLTLAPGTCFWPVQYLSKGDFTGNFPIDIFCSLRFRFKTNDRMRRSKER